MTNATAIATLTLVAVLLIMWGEVALSAFNERVLRARGAVEAERDVLRPMVVAYPACFVAMTIEGAFAGPSPPDVLAVGLLVFGVSKALKAWAISALGVRWTFRVLVLPAAPLVTRGPYRFLNHPNYLAILGEILGVALIVWAPVTGAVGLIGYAVLLRRKTAVEDRALGRK